MLKALAESSGKKWSFCAQALSLTQSAFREELDQSVSGIAQAKHGKKVDGIDYPRLLEKIGNVLARVTSGKVFGYFEDARRIPFRRDRFRGVFRNARGPKGPFIDVWNFEATEDLPSEYVFLFDTETGRGLNLFPLVLRGLDRQAGYDDEPDFYVFDISRDREVGFRAVQERAEVIITPATSEYQPVWAEIAKRLQNDELISWSEGFEFKIREML
jgi:hypothetical protein